MSTRNKPSIHNNKTRKLSSPTHTFTSLQYPGYLAQRQERREKEELKNDLRRIQNEMREEKKKSEKRKIEKIKNNISQAELRKQEVFGLEKENADEDEELADINDTWKDTEGDFKPIRKSPTVSGSLNELKGGKRKRNRTKKKRYNATKKKRSKK